MSNSPRISPCRAAFMLLALTACGDESPIEPAVRGSMVVVVQSFGPDVDPDGYTLVLDGTTNYTLPVVGTTTITDLSVGEHALALTGLSTNCRPAAALPTSVSIAADSDATVNIDMACTKLLQHDFAYAYNGDIYLRPATGEPPIQLTSDGVSDSPAWSPDGRRLAFQKRTGRFLQGNDLYVMDADGAGIIQLTSETGIYDAQPEWSPDGSLILFRRRVPGEVWPDLYTIRPDGSGLTNLTPGSGDGNYGDWSPDGRQIAFASARRGTEPWYGGVIAELHVMNADGSGVRSLGDGMEWRGTHLEPEWSPDGTRIVFWTFTGFGMRLFEERWSYQINADGTDLVELGYSYVQPLWSPDGSRILLTRIVQTSNFDTSRLELREFLSGEVRPLLPDSQSEQALGVWSPDGALIAFCTGRRLFVIAPDGTGLEQLLPYCALVAWRPSAP